MPESIDEHGWPPSEVVHVLEPSDDVGVVLKEGLGTPVGHKVALRTMQEGSPVHKCGHVIGWASRTIRVGEHVHSHNLVHGGHAGVAPRGDSHHDDLPQVDCHEFRAVVRGNGEVATRNVLAVVSTVNCTATVCQRIVAAAEANGLRARWPGIDAIVPITHTSGCGLAGEGENLSRLRRTLAGHATHVNVGGLLVVSLGCEVNQLDGFLDDLHPRPDLLVESLVVQQQGGTRAAIAAGVVCLERLARDAAQVERVRVGLEGLVVGLNCGGSDGWSGLTANPALGVASDLVVAAGGRSVLAETPEIYGAEDLLLTRAETPRVADQLRRVLARWESEARLTGESLDNNPSPGNRAGGITTILEKSLGAVVKGGHAPLRAVYQYAEAISVPGFGFMDTPGYDPVSVTGLIAGGANVVVFTTGRGSALGYGLVPVIKVATNSDIHRRMHDDMDLNAGDIIDVGVGIDAKGVEIYHFILEVASGRRTRSEELGYGAHEFVPWLTGTVF